MGVLFGLLSAVRGARVRAQGDPWDDRWWVPAPWTNQLSAAGVRVSPELAMTLSAVYCAVTTIADDISTMPPHIFRRINDDQKARADLRGLSYLLRWQPNDAQTAKEFWGTMIGHQLLRGRALAQIVPGARGEAIGQLVPKHPDRIQGERLPDGRMRYLLLNQFNRDGSPVWLSQDETFVLRDFSSDGVRPLSRIEYGLQSFGAALAQERFSQKFFKSGATAALVATHKGGEMDDADRADLHANLSRYAAGVENSFGIMLVEEDVSIEKLGVEPEKAQLIEAREFTIREVARWFKMPGHKLEAAVQTQAYAAREAANLEYVIGCLRPIVIGIEQAIQRDLILDDEKEDFFVEFVMEALLRGDTKARSEYYTRAIKTYWMRPSEVRTLENLPPDPALDRLAENAFKPGQAAARAASDARATSRHGYRAVLLTHEQAARVIRKEVAAVTALAKRHATDGAAWQAGLREFYEGHARHVGETMFLPLPVAREYCARHGLLLQEHGVGVMDDWCYNETSELGMLSLDLAAAA